MMKIFYYIALSSILASVGAFANQSEVEKLRGTIDAALDVLYSESSLSMSKDEKQAKVRSVLEDKYELDVIIRRAIGRNWSKLNNDQQEETLELVKKLIIKAYVNWVDGKARPKVELGEMIVISDKRMEILSQVHLEDQSVTMLYRLGLMHSGWQIYDVVAEDISVVSNYRQQIDDHFRKGDGEGLIAKLKELVNKEEIDENFTI